MKKILVTVLVVLLFGYTSYSQGVSAADRVALSIPKKDTYSTEGISNYVKSHFTSDSDRVRALFVWVANNIVYDVERLRTRSPLEKIPLTDVLKSRRAVCQGYAELLVELFRTCNIKGVLVPGYTKVQDGTIADLSHAWVAAQLNDKWYLFDPTWSSGMVKDLQFTKRFTNRFYKVAPEEMIKDHMPFDPMYQFLNYPVLYDEFNSGNAEIKTSKPFFNYTDTITHFNSLDTLNQFISAARRINNNGEKKPIVNEMLTVLTKNQRAGESKLGYTGAVSEFKQATDIFNKYIAHKNQRFTSVRDDLEIRGMMDSVLRHIQNAYAMLSTVLANTDEQKRLLTDINAALFRFNSRVNDENSFLKKYLQTDRSVRN
ncbi:hypothetical protein EXU57_00450 [Segetibacter sp. 3557_3]|uniref:transglutaminase domain-containing protein n=1 Tax=Segetibacter sp. 3557_3 TaxID=2547429 RepID=UPI0010589730|nr:transglutaminase domain-containing protein [Segetibacter sp. 3557_3]TDH28582.1 hypothetical protein EXU57_00450 [Segetibacter sp. 3557_3]